MSMSLRQGWTWPQCFDNFALGNRVVTTASDNAHKFVAHRGKVGNLAFDVGEMPTRNRIDCTARLVAIICKRQQLAYGIKAESEIARTADKRQPLEMLAPIFAIVGISPCRQWEQSCFLVKTDGFDLCCGRLCQLADFHHITL